MNGNHLTHNFLLTLIVWKNEDDDGEDNDDEAEDEAKVDISIRNISIKLTSFRLASLNKWNFFRLFWLSKPYQTSLA